MIDASTQTTIGFDSLAAMFLAQAKRYGNRVLYRYWQSGQWRSLTWNESLTQAREIALGLVSLGISRGDRVALLSSNRLDWLLTDWANICIGALTVPIYASSSPAQAVHIVGHADPTVLFIDSITRFDKLDFSRTPLSQLKSIIVFDNQAAGSPRKLAASVLALDELRQLGRAYQERHAGVFELLVQSLRPEDDLTIIYTSGTTGAPKGVLTTHGHYLFMIRSVDAAVPSTDRDVTMHFLPTAHSLGRLEHFMAVANGWTLGVARSIETMASDLKVVRPTVIFSVPRIYQNAYNRIRQRVGRAGGWQKRIFDWGVAEGKERSAQLKFAVDHAAGSVEPFKWGFQRGRVSPLVKDGVNTSPGKWLRLLANRLSWPRELAFACVDRLMFAPVRAGFGGRLRLAISGGAPLSPDIAEFFHAIGIKVLEGYGLTETSTVSHVNRPSHFKLGTVGLALDGTDCSVAPDGEILLRGPHIFKCYYRDLIATDDAVDADGWFHTGDVGEIDNDGFLRVTERKRDLIVTSSGKKVAPQKIENLLTADPLIHHALIVGRGQRHLMALITLDQSRAVELARAAGIAIGSGASLASHPWMRGRVREIVRRANQELAVYEAIRDFCILDRDFTVAAEELTPTLKPRRQVIVERYKELIEDLYRKAS
jgi:long-chain acyl-CoA synthetase